MSTILRLHFTEPDGVLVSDATGNLNDLRPDTPDTIEPSSVEAWTGRGRQFTQADSCALLAGDVSDLGTLLLRNATIRVLLSLTLDGAAGPQVIVCRGTNDGPIADRYAWGLEVEEQADFAGYVEVRWFWHDTGGTLRKQAAGVFKHLGDGKEFQLAATRRWEASDRVVLRYYVGDDMIAELVSEDGSIAGGTIGKTSVGGRRSGGVWSSFLNGTLDELEVLDKEMSPEEVREDWKRLTVHQPAGVEMFAGLAPPGIVWTRDPGNDIGRLVKIAGQALGFGIASIERMRSLFLPDRATLERISRWERICGLVPRPNYSLDVRRTRVVSYLAREEGFALPSIRETFAEILALDADDVEILEFTNEVTESFTELNAERWFVGGDATFSIAGDVLELEATTGDDLRWTPTMAFAHVRASLGQSGGRFSVQGKLVDYWTSLPANTLVGLFLLNRVSNNAIWFGAKNVGGTRQIGYQIYASGAMGAFVALDAVANDVPTWVRIRPRVGAGDDATMRFEYSYTGPTSGFVGIDVATGVEDVEWCGFAAHCDDDALAGDVDVRFDDFKMLAFEGLRTFCWYAYRDPALSGEPDMLGAHLLAQKVKPAHTHASAITSRSVLCDDPDEGLCDHGPCGAL